MLGLPPKTHAMKRIWFALATMVVATSAHADAPLQPSATVATSTEVREDILRLMDSLRTAEDFSVANVERHTGEVFREEGRSGEGALVSHRMWARVRQGWTYGYDVGKSMPPELSATINIGLTPERRATPERKATCTLPFESFARRMERLGYQRHPSASQEPARTRNTRYMPFLNSFRRPSGSSPLVFVMVYHYPPESSGTVQPTCIARIQASLQTE